MPITAKIYRILIASPGDVIEERNIIEERINHWNKLHSEAEGITLLPKRWETDATPDLNGENAQVIVNRQIVDGCDLLIGIFWTKLGTPTGRSDSGTAEEIERVRSAGKRCLLYFSDKLVSPSQHNPSEYKRLQEYKDNHIKNSRGMYGNFNDLNNLKETIDQDLIKVVREIKQKESEEDVIPERGEKSFLKESKAHATDLSLYLNESLVENKPTLAIKNSMTAYNSKSGGIAGIHYIELPFSINFSMSKSFGRLEFTSQFIIDDFFRVDRDYISHRIPSFNNQEQQDFDYKKFFNFDNIIPMPNNKIGYESSHKKVLNTGEWARINIKMPIPSTWYPLLQEKLLNCEMNFFTYNSSVSYPLIIKILPGNY